MNYIKELFYGNISPADQKIVKSSEYAELSDSCEKMCDELKKLLPEEGVEKLNKLCECNFNLSAMTAEEYYVLGFRDGARLMLDVLKGENEELTPVCE